MVAPSTGTFLGGSGTIAVGSYPTGCDQPSSWHHRARDDSRRGRLPVIQTRPGFLETSRSDCQILSVDARRPTVDGVTDTSMRQGDPSFEDERDECDSCPFAPFGEPLARLALLERARPGEGLPVPPACLPTRTSRRRQRPAIPGVKSTQTRRWSSSGRSSTGRSPNRRLDMASSASATRSASSGASSW